jgi:hypothetical protein
MIKTTLLALLSGLLMTASGATLTDNYVLSSSLNDTLGGPSLVADGGTQSATGYSFAANQGLNLSSALSNSGDYSILMDFSFSTLSGFRKILDFQNRAADAGLYNLSTALNFFPPVTGSPGVFSPDVLARVVLTRDAGTGVVTGYVNGAQQLAFTDSTSIAVFGASNNIIRFFEDDNVTGQGEASGGRATEIQIYNGALSNADVLALGGPSTTPVSGVPEPAALTLVGFGLLSLGLVRRLKA